MRSEYVTNPCSVCGTLITARACEYKRGRGRTCSRKCSSQRAQSVKWDKRYREFDAEFWSRVEIGTPEKCWPWTANKYPSGYGRFKMHRRQRLAHRHALELAKGPTPISGLLALHSCDNPICCNPDHLRWGTHRDNTQDCIKRGRFGRGSPNTTAATTLRAKAQESEAAIRSLTPGSMEGQRE